MNIKYYLTPLIRYWWLLLSAALVAAICSFIVVAQQPPIYQTRTSLIIGRAVYEANPSSQDLWLTTQLSSYYAEIGRRADVQDATMKALGLSGMPEYTVQPLPNSQLLEIIVTDSDPLRAQAVADELARQLVNRSPINQTEDQDRQKFINDQIKYLEVKIKETLDEITQAELNLMELTSARQISEAQAQIEALQTKLSQLQQNYATLISNTQQGAVNTLTVIETAALPTRPIGPQKALTVGLAALVAVVIATGAAYLLEYLDDTFKSSYDVTHVLNVPVIGQISEIQSIKAENPAGPAPKRLPLLKALQSLILNRRMVPDVSPEVMEGVYIAGNPRSLIAESFRSLRINLDFEGINQPVRTILISSPEPAEGKTSIATNLAVVMAQGGRRVIIIDADLRKPAVHKSFNLSNQIGLSDVLLEQMHLHEVIRPWEEKNVSVITSGNLPPNPVDLLSSPKFSGILEQLKQWTDIIIIDGPPMVLPDSIALSTKVDAVLVVVRHGYTRKEFARTGLDQLKRVGARIVGVVLNRIPRSGVRYGPEGYYGYYEGESKASRVGLR